MGASYTYIITVMSNEIIDLFCFYINSLNNLGRVLYPSTGSLAEGVECLPMTRKTWVQWYLIPPCLTLSNIRYVSRVKGRNPGKWVAPSATPRGSSYWKGSLRVALDYGRQLYLLALYPSTFIQPPPTPLLSLWIIVACQWRYLAVIFNDDKNYKEKRIHAFAKLLVLSKCKKKMITVTQ